MHFHYIQKKALYLSVKVFLKHEKYYLGKLFLCLQLETGPPFYVVIGATQRSSGLQCKGSALNSFHSYFKTLSIGPAPGNKTFHSVVKHSTDWANPTEVKASRFIFLFTYIFKFDWFNGLETWKGKERKKKKKTRTLEQHERSVSFSK